MAPISRDDFQVAIICALPIEYNAASLVFDQFWDDGGDRYGRARGDNNHYTTGRIGKHNVVLALLPHMGNTDAASAAASMRLSYSFLELVLLVGVCGVIPSGPEGEILLGDVIISKSVVQYDFGRQYSDRFVRKDTVEDNLSQPNKDIQGLLKSFETDRVITLLEQRTAASLQELQAKSAARQRQGKDKYKYPGTARDMLFEVDHRHKHRGSAACICCACVLDTDPVCDEALKLPCDKLGCEATHLKARERLNEKQQLEQEDNIAAQNPTLHIGAVASGDSVIKSAKHRDAIAESESIIAFEMEGAGVWKEVPCIVVKGVCDYADCHKNKGWQNFAAATAACVAKAILERYIQTDRPQDSTTSKPRQGLQGLGRMTNDGTEASSWDNVRIQFGDNNRGSQTGINHGTISNTFGR
jgi:nucleoside phosphorylase